MFARASIAAIALLASAAALAAESGRLRLPDFSHLQSKAIESVDVTVGPFMLGLASLFAPERDADGTEIKKIIKGISAVYIRSYQFDADYVYSKDDIESVRKQLRDAKWLSLAQIHSRAKDENVDIFVALENDKPAGFAILASEPREFTIVNVVGTLDPEHIGKLRRSLDLPAGVSTMATSNDW